MVPKKNLCKDSLSNVDESVDKIDILDENPLVSHEDEDQHGPLNSLMMITWITFHFQDCCLMQ
jgi:hypothetical protein